MTYKKFVLEELEKETEWEIIMTGVPLIGWITDIILFGVILPIKYAFEKTR